MKNDFLSYMQNRKIGKIGNAVTRILNLGLLRPQTQCTNHYTITATLSDVQLLIYSLMNDIT